LILSEIRYSRQAAQDRLRVIGSKKLLSEQFTDLLMFVGWIVLIIGVLCSIAG
jgi:hypothetical protein